MSEGLRYNLNSIAFRGEKVFPVEPLRQQFQITDGDIFNAETIRVGLPQSSRAVYHAGLHKCRPVPEADADDASATVSLSIYVDGGKQFRLGNPPLDGQEPHAGDRAKLLETWNPMQGNVYDNSKLEQWCQRAQTMIARGARLERSLELRQHLASGIVNVLVRFPAAN